MTKRLLPILVLLFLFTPLKTMAVDLIGGRCFCEMVKKCVACVDTTLNIELGQTYTTSDEATCQTACETEAEERSGYDWARSIDYLYKVVDSSYSYPTEEQQKATAEAAAEAIRHKYLTPELSVDIPGLSFGNVLSLDGKLQIDFLATYINAVYTYLLGAAAIVAIVMIMIGGVQYMIGSSVGHADAARKRIQNAAIGLVLILGAYVILRVINPELTSLKSIQLVEVEAVALDLDTSGLEGEVGGGSAADCDGAFDLAQASESCPLTQELYSPNGKPFSCNYHFRDANYDWEEMKAGLDFPAAWASEVVAPGDGTVKFITGDGSNRCGNYIDVNLTGGGRFTICHIKAFASGLSDGSTVKAGQTIGYVGGRCCAASALTVNDAPPKGWSMFQRGWCTFEGTVCGNPAGGNTDCDCQEWQHSGNTSGPHAHGSLFAGSSRTSLLACLSENYDDLSAIGSETSESEDRVCTTDETTGQTTCE